MKQRKIVIFDGLQTTGKSTQSYTLAKSLPGWIFVDIWRIKDMFEPLGYSTNLNKEEKQKLNDLSKMAIVWLVKKIIHETGRNIILQETTRKFIKKHLASDLKKYHYKLYVVQLTVPFNEAVKRGLSRDKPTSRIDVTWNEETWNEKVKRKIKEENIVIDTHRNNTEKTNPLILKAIGEKSKKHPHESKIKRFW